VSASAGKQLHDFAQHQSTKPRKNGRIATLAATLGIAAAT